MKNLSFLQLFYMFLPTFVIFVIYQRWTKERLVIPTAISRMFLQLILVGYLLSYIFKTKNQVIILTVLTIMLISASIISLRPVAKKEPKLYLYTLISTTIGGIFVIWYVIVFVLELKLWYEPRYIIPLSGMLFSNAMNSISIAAERFENEINTKDVKSAMSLAYRASLIPILNSYFAVGLVSIPGLMTGQILSGVSPIEAVKYQILIMLMILLSSGISSAIFLKLVSLKKLLL